MAARKDGAPKALTPHQLKSQQLYLVDEDKKIARRAGATPLTSSLTESEREALRAEIKKHTEEFLAAGGKITRLPPDASSSKRNYLNS